ncbi:DUF2809 domain-containing protein [Hymenobacter sp. YC55]|uniref:ribosomal maturation YjgA family protein n=1 Tax=Hymenobacter sp. YC55 TaxID=3034019 RepID=UPI0023F84841|nr:DUF2809 domain-containing protein [Hymenobacter sp. YC55]MDF7813053.1 DUF2809 domain-containing protein [Hymenobacter sp. YC55]
MAIPLQTNPQPRHQAERMRSKKVYAVLIVLTILLGLASRKYGFALPTLVAAYAGDTLWALLVFWLLGFCCPDWTSRRVAGWALLFAFLIETSQLYHAPWLDALRNTTPGSLVLGHGFLWSDLLCYSVGVACGYGFERVVLRKQQ